MREILERLVSFCCCAFQRLENEHNPWSLFITSSPFDLLQTATIISLILFLACSLITSSEMSTLSIISFFFIIKNIYIVNYINLHCLTSITVEGITTTLPYREYQIFYFTSCFVFFFYQLFCIKTLTKCDAKVTTHASY